MKRLSKRHKLVTILMTLATPALVWIAVLVLGPPSQAQTSDGERIVFGALHVARGQTVRLNAVNLGDLGRTLELAILDLDGDTQASMVEATRLFHSTSVTYSVGGGGPRGGSPGYFAMVMGSDLSDVVATFEVVDIKTGHVSAALQAGRPAP